MPTNQIAQTLLALLDNQVSRTEAAFDGVTYEIFNAEPGGSCNSMLVIARHLVGLRIFQQALLGISKASKPDPKAVVSLEKLLSVLLQEDRALREAIEQYPASDWFATPPAPREGRWGDEPTIQRFVRPFNDFTNHLGAIRALRRIMNCPAEKTQ